jgi:hypothetical protein
MHKGAYLREIFCINPEISVIAYLEVAETCSQLGNEQKAEYHGP